MKFQIADSAETAESAEQWKALFTLRPVPYQTKKKVFSVNKHKRPKYFTPDILVKVCSIKEVYKKKTKVTNGSVQSRRKNKI